MSKRALRSPLKVLAATSVAIFSLLTVFTSTAAWFDSRRSLDNGGDNFEVQSPSRRLKSISFHKVVQIDYDEDILYFDQSPVSTATASQFDNDTVSIGFEMDHYTLLRKQNPLLALIELSEVFEISNNVQIQLDISTESANFLTSYDAEYVAEMTNRPLSNIISFSGGYLTSNTGGDNEGGTLSGISQTSNMTYSTDPEKTSSAQYVLDMPNDYASFWTINAQGNPTLTSPTMTLFSGTNGQKVQYVYVIFEYNQPLLELIYNHFLGRSFLEKDLVFCCDWKLRV